MKPVFVNAIGLAAPGLEGWQHAVKVFTGKQPYNPQPLVRYKSNLLPPNERRRATELVCLAFRACEDALTGRVDSGQLASVFASSGGDYHIFDQVCRTLKTPDRAVSPTQFHNSVHNAAAGYWGIAVKSEAASTTLSGYDATFAAGLLESIVQLEIDKVDILYAAFDVVPPMLLQNKRPVYAPFSTALQLSHKKSVFTLAELNVSLVAGKQSDTPASCEAYELLRQGNPSAGGIPMLEAIAKGDAVDLFFSMPSSKLSLKVVVSPC